MVAGVELIHHLHHVLQDLLVGVVLKLTVFADVQLVDLKLNLSRCVSLIVNPSHLIKERKSKKNLNILSLFRIKF